METLAGALAEVMAGLRIQASRLGVDASSSASTTEDGAGPVCARCGGVGYFRLDRPVGDREFAQLVSCPACAQERTTTKETARMEQLSRGCGLSEAMRACNFNTFRVYEGNGPAFREATRFADTGVDERRWLILQGPCGVGKTHLLAAIANKLLVAGKAVVYAYVPDLLDTLRQGYARQERGGDDQGAFNERFDRVRGADVLLLDDLGAQVNSPWVVEKLESLIDYRDRERLPMAITTNMARPLANISERVGSRFERYYPQSTIVLEGVRPYHEVVDRRRAG